MHKKETPYRVFLFLIGNRIGLISVAFPAGKLESNRNCPVPDNLLVYFPCILYNKEKKSRKEANRFGTAGFYS